jgi:hypothetical protein
MFHPLCSQWIVTLDRFGKVCDLFGPVLAAPPKRNSNILQNVHDVLRTEWFHGEISREEAESRLTGVVPGTYLVPHPRPITASERHVSGVLWWSATR